MVEDRKDATGSGGDDRWQATFLAVPNYVPATFAVLAVVLYALGVIKSVGELRASHVEVSQGMALIPLEEHLRNGVGILVSPVFLFFVLIYIPLYFRIRDAVDNGRPFPPPATGWLRVYFAVIGVSLVVIAIVGPWPFIFLAAIAVAGMMLPVWLPRVLGGPWERRTAGLYIACGLGSLALISGLSSYFRSDPLPKASFRTDTRRVEGPLIGTSDGIIYLAPASSKGLYRAEPVARVQQLTVVRQEREDDPSLLNLIGIG